MERDEQLFRENTPYDAMGDYSPLLSMMKQEASQQEASQQEEDSFAVAQENKEGNND